MSDKLSERILILEEVALVASTGDLHLVYDKAMAAVASIMGVEVASIQLLDDEGQGLRFAATLIPEELSKLQKADPIPVNEDSVSGYVVKHGMTRLFADSWADPVFGERQRHVGEDVNSANRSFICAPLIARGSVIGAISILHREPDQFSETDKNLATTLASSIATAVDHAQFVNDVRRAAVDIISPDLEDVLNESMRALNVLLGIEVGSLQQLDDTGQALKFVATLVPDELTKLQENGSIPVDDNSVSGYVVQHGLPKLFSDSWADPLFGERQRRVAREVNSANRSFICVPLRAREKVIGVLSALHAEPNMFTEAELRMMVILANFVAIGIELAE